MADGRFLLDCSIMNIPTITDPGPGGWDHRVRTRDPNDTFTRSHLARGGMDSPWLCVNEEDLISQRPSTKQESKYIVR